MSELPKDFLKFVSEVILLLIILIALFGGSGMFSNTISYTDYAEPIRLQSVVAKYITVGSYMPGEFTATLNVNKNIVFKFTKEEDINYLNIDPEKSTLKTDFVGIKKIPIPTICTIEPETFTIEETPATITVSKTETQDGCKVVIS
jgi:hypothetical protein